MLRHLTRRALAVLAGLLAVPILGLSVAWACTALATIDMDHKEGAVVGDVVNGTGRGFSATTPNQVEIRLDGREGPLLASVRPAPNGTIAFSFTVPSAAAGDHVVVATQNGVTGQPASGTPARAPFTVSDPGAPPAPAQPAAPAQQQPAQPAPAQAVPAQPAPAAPAPAAAPRTDAVVPAQPAPAVVAPADREAVPVPAAEAPAAAGQRATMMAPAAQSLLLPLVMAAAGLLLTLGSGAYVLATRRSSRPAEAQARR
jgi:hypothetical protein